MAGKVHPCEYLEESNRSISPLEAHEGLGVSSSQIPTFPSLRYTKLLEHKANLELLRHRPEWRAHHIEIKFRHRRLGQPFYEICCLDTVDCAKQWQAFYILTKTDMHPPCTLILQTRGEHSHEQLSIAVAFVDTEADIPGTALPTPTQMSNWLRRQKQKSKTVLAKHKTLVEVAQLQLAQIPRSLPDDALKLLLLEEPIMSKDEVCVMFSCRAMLHQLARYDDTVLRCKVDAKMKVANDGYGVATFGLHKRHFAKNDFGSLLGWRRCSATSPRAGLCIHKPRLASGASHNPPADRPKLSAVFPHSGQIVARQQVAGSHALGRA